ncbi:hypothetical protein GTO91_09945 [Heliobacterium undosum]|uniref:Uncharacterized protein n=1 Tax=Heliomicrobium undosum TaxID=121734 RepID=A0A845L2V7_9FIRM|nr:hypothetical protein [Heliomicrobium undosum]MZP30026.1 hypothetical protein [Heliomicrobium undosum]
MSNHPPLLATFEGLIEQLTSVQADDRLWDFLPPLLDQLQTLIEAKGLERQRMYHEQALRAQVNNRLLSLLQQYGEELAYHEIEHWQNWSADNPETIDQKWVDLWLDAIDNLQHHLDAYRELRHKPAGTRREEKERRKAQDASESNIIQFAESLSPLAPAPGLSAGAGNEFLPCVKLTTKASDSLAPLNSVDVPEPLCAPNYASELPDALNSADTTETVIPKEPTADFVPDDSDLADASKTADDIDSVETPVPVDTFDCGDTLETAGGPDLVEAFELADSVDSDDASELVDSPDLAETSELVDPVDFADTSEPANAQDLIGAAEPTDTLNSTEALEVPSPSDKTSESVVLPVLREALRDDRFALAFWLAHGTTGEKAPPPWVVKTAFLSRYCTRSGNDAIVHFNPLIYGHHHPVLELTRSPWNLPELEAHLWITLSASVPALLAPDTTVAGNWFFGEHTAPEPLGQLHKLIAEFSSFGQPLFRVGGKSAADLRALEKKAAEQAQATADWLSAAEHATLPFAQATFSLRHISSQRHPLGRMARLVAANSQARWKEVRAYLQETLYDKRAIEDLIQRDDALPPSDRLTRQIEGKAQKRLIAELDKLRLLLAEWVEASTQLDKARQSPEWSNNRIETFCCNYLDIWKTVDPWLKRKISASPPLSSLSIVANKARDVLSALAGWISNGGISADLADGAGIQSIFAADLLEPLLLLRQVPVSEENELPGEISPIAALELAHSIREGRTLTDSFEDQLVQGDFFAAKLILERSEQRDPQVCEEGRHRYEEALREERDAFRRKCQDLRQALEQDTIDHVLMENERSEMEGELLSLENSRSFRYNILNDKLNDLSNRLAELRSFRVQSLSVELNRLREEVDAADPDRGAQASPFLEKAAAALEQSDLALADEYLAQVENVLRYGKADEYLLDEEPRSGDDLSRFLDVFQSLSSVLQDQKSVSVHRDLARGNPVAGLNEVKNLPTPRRKEIEIALSAFRELKQFGTTPTLKDPKVAELTGNILQYLGFLAPQVTVEDRDRHYCHLAAQMSGGEVSPLPEFGSLRQGSYKIVLLWERPGAETISQILEHVNISANCPIILYLGRMGLRQRNEWAQHCRANELTAMLIDELLLCFLATQKENRLPAAVHCALAFGYANPYTPFGAGNVPTEMFKGRKSIIRSLMEPTGAAILFGGRQLGKSAIQRRVEKVFSDPKKQQYVFFDDIKSLGEPGGNQQTHHVWSHLHAWLVRNNLIKSTVLDTADRIHDAMLRQFESNPELRILVLLDEADNFLTADAEKNFETLHQLKKIMEDTERRFKVVLSGLHSVQRYTGLSNHPFAHLQKVNIGPLEGKAARALIEEPFKTLGFKFADSDVVYRILAYTNYHPALIQLFCKELLRHEYANRRLTGRPYHKVTMESVEAVYRKPDLRKEMNDRFEWTVGLDKRYEVLVYAMIYDQMDVRDGYRKVYTYRQILDMARHWWKEGFKDINDDHARSLLDELVGLGVLVKNPEKGIYRLRNANIARALGTNDEIEQRLCQFIDRPAPAAFSVQSMRPCLDRTECAWSPLTFAQEGYLLKKQAGLGLIFASPALGYEHLESALQRVAVPPEDNLLLKSSYLPLPADCLSMNRIIAYLQTQVRGNRSGRLVFHGRSSQLTAAGASIVASLNELHHKLLDYRRARDRSVYFFISFDDSEILDWCRLPRNSRLELENRANALVSASRWDAEMICRFLHEYGMMNSSPVGERVLQSTGGWPWLLKQLLNIIVDRTERKSFENLDPRHFLPELEQQLQKDRTFARAFLQETGLISFREARETLQFIIDFGEAGENEVVELLADERNLELDTVLGHMDCLKRLAVIETQQDRILVEPIIANMVANDELWQ